jgi:UDP-N-acetylmuramate: L-alanyl-gamma-D-glutamyl-meso-diaminopimelate ligase
LATAARSSNETLRSPSIEGDGLDLLFSSFNRHVILLHMLTGIRSVHFVGIGGTAMASAAVAMQEKGYTVTGSDQNVYPPMSTFLAERKLPVMLGYAEQNLAHKPDLVVIGNAISRGNPEAEAVLDRKLRYCSLPELLKEFFIRGKRSVVVTGTHGKTTTTSLLTWVFEHNGLNPSYLIGGIPNNFSQGARFTDSEWFIIEGDEYDTAFFDKRSKFVHYLPEVAIINNVEFDHADIFENLGAIQTAFKRFINLIPRNGQLLANGDDTNLAPLLDVTHCPVKRFGLGEANAWRAYNLVLAPTVTEFETPSFKFRINLLGELNVRNALAVVAAARHCGLKNHQIQSAFDTFKGTKRRMEVRGVSGGVTVVDDFGHHPTAIRETLKALRVKFKGQKIWAVFEPRSNTTRRNVFQTELVDAFADADAVVVAEVARPEQLQPEERLDPARLMQDLKGKGKAAEYLANADMIVNHLGQHAEGGDVVCVFSNGGFDGIHAKLLQRLDYGRRK